jgi:hypothetical protein
MLPGVYGFHWTAGYLIFLGVFYTVLLVIISALLIAAFRSVKVFRSNRVESIRWTSDFHDLLERDRRCRHEITGEVKSRVCPKAFDCRVCSDHPRFVANRRSLLEAIPHSDGDDTRILGFNMPADRWYHRGHTWVKPMKDGMVTVGLDDLGARLIGKPDRVDLPPAGTRLQVNGTGWHMNKGGAHLRVLSPVDGEVIETGSPEKGWFLRLRPLYGIVDVRHLLSGDEIRPWLVREMERLQMSMATEGAGMSLADGGVLELDFSKDLPAAKVEAVLGEMFLEP